MKTIKFFLILFAILATFYSIFFVFTGEKVQVFQPKGTIAKQELELILFNLTMMLSILTPTFILLLITAWKYRTNNKQAKYDPEKKHGKLNQTILWILPAIVVAIMAIVTWKQTHHLDPYKPLGAKDEEMTIQVIALDWKWLFIYPDQGIATLNFVQFPEKKAIRFELTADGSPMNSFWIPHLSGQIYCMTGMVTPLHLMADGVGSYPGRAAEINGKGYAKMTFVAQSSTKEDFDKWINEVKQSPLKLDDKLYAELIKPSVGNLPQSYSHVEKDLFETVVMKVNRP